MSFEELSEIVRAERIGIVKDDDIGRKAKEGLSEEASVGERERLRRDFGEAPRADDLHAVDGVLRVPFFMVEAEHLLFARSFERRTDVAGDLFDSADVRREIVADL